LNVKFCRKQYNKIFDLHLIEVPQLSSGLQHDYSTKARKVGRANEQSMYSPMSMVEYYPIIKINLINTFSLHLPLIGFKPAILGSMLEKNLDQNF
jgi:hypothetical protein